METIDIAIVVLGVVVLASAVAGALLYEPDAGARTFTVDWTVDAASLDSQDASLGSSGGSETFSFDVPQRNVTKGTFTATLQVESGHVSQDTLNVTVTAPNGDTVADETPLASGSSQTSLEVSLTVATVPTQAKVQAQNATEAVAKLDEKHGTDAGTGTWQVEVTVDHGTGLYAGSHDVEVAPNVGFFGAEVTPESPEVRGN